MLRKSRLLSLFCGLASAAFAETSGDSELKLWQITFTAPTRYEDGYTVKGKAKEFAGSFHFEDGRLLKLEGRVHVSSIKKGLEARDASMREVVFTGSDGRMPDVAFRAKPTSCASDGEGWSCQVQGEFQIRDEWQAVAVDVYLSEYQGQAWLHAEGKLKLSQYDFYATGSSTLKVADEISVVIDLLGAKDQLK